MSNYQVQPAYNTAAAAPGGPTYVQAYTPSNVVSEGESIAWRWIYLFIVLAFLLAAAGLVYWVLKKEYNWFTNDNAAHRHSKYERNWEYTGYNNNGMDNPAPVANPTPAAGGNGWQRNNGW